MIRTKPKPYTRLIHVAGKVLNADYELTDEEKKAFGVAVMENITPYEASMNMSGMGINDIWWTINEEYDEYSDTEICEQFVYHYDCDSLEEYIKDYDLPLPDRDDMIESIISDIDEEDYINERYEDILDFIPEQFEFNLSDEEIIELFVCFVDDTCED